MTAYAAIELRLPTPRDPNLLELVFARFDDFQPVAIDEPDRFRLRVFFSAPYARDAALSAIVSDFAAHGVSGRALDIDDEDWAARSQAKVHAVTVGRVVIAPPWDHKGVGSLFPEKHGEKTPDPITIVIEPSMGFGTGHHESTRLCLDALQRLDLAGRRVLDIGTGSGVLGIAAVLLGAATVVAIDVDVDALQAARQNARLNDVDSRITFAQADFRDASLSAFDVVLANLTGALVNKTLGRLVELTEPGGFLIVSGFTRDELVARVDGSIETSQDVRVVDRLDEEGWRAFVVTRLC